MAIIILLTALEAFAHGAVVPVRITASCDYFSPTDKQQYIFQGELYYGRLLQRSQGLNDKSGILMCGIGLLDNSKTRWRLGLLEADFSRKISDYNSDSSYTYTRFCMSVLDFNSAQIFNSDFQYLTLGAGIGYNIISPSVIRTDQVPGRGKGGDGLSPSARDSNESFVHIGADITPIISLRSFSLGANFPSISDNNDVLYSGFQAGAEGRIIVYSMKHRYINVYGRAFHTFASQPLSELSTGLQASLMVSSKFSFQLSAGFHKIFFNEQQQSIIQVQLRSAYVIDVIFGN